MRGGVAVGVFALVLLLGVGCTGSNELSASEREVRLSAAGDPAPQPLGDAVKLDGESASLRQDEMSVEVPLGAVASEATLQFGQSLGAVDGEVFGRPVSVEVIEPLAEPLELRWDIAEVTEQQRASIVPLRWDEDLEVWAVDESDATDLSVDGDELVLVTSEFSWRSWSWAADFGQLVGERTGSRRSGPSCEGELPSWVANVVDPGAGTSAAAIQVCFEPDGDDTITVRVVNNRPFTQRLEMTEGNQPWAWTWTGRQSYDLSAAVTVAARQVFDSDTAFLLPPLSETAVGIDRPQGGGSHFISATAIADHNTFLVDGVDYLLGLVTPGGFEDQLLNEFVALVYECGGSAALSDTDFTRVSTAIVDVMASCVSEVMTSNTDYGARFDAARIGAMAAASPERQAQLVKMNRSLHQLARAAHLLKAGELAFYFTDQLQNAYVGNLTLSISATGRAGELGDWTAACDDLTADSNQLFRNLTLRDPFYDTSRDLWEFDELEPAAEQAVQPLEDCDEDYLRDLANLLPGDWGDQRAASVVADAIRGEFASGRADCSDASVLEAWRSQVPQPWDASLRGLTCSDGWARADLIEPNGDYGGTLAMKEENGHWLVVHAGVSIRSLCDQLARHGAPEWTRGECAALEPLDSLRTPEPSPLGFVTPSGNIACVDLAAWGNEGVRCQIDSGLTPPPDAPCDLDWTGIELSGRGPAAPVCADDSITGDRTTTVLEYGETWTAGDVSCMVTETGLSCEHTRSLLGFWLSRQSWAIDTPVG